MAELLVRSRALRSKRQPRSWRRGLGRTGLGAALACGALLVARAAEAQISVTLPTTQPTREVALRVSTEDPYAVSYADCMAFNRKGDVYTFQTTLTGYQGYTLQVWAGTDTCADPNERTTPTSATCWEVYSGQPNNRLWAVPIRVQDVIGMHLPSATKSGPGSGTWQDCNAQTASAPQSVNLNFMLVGSGGAIQGTTAQYQLTYDLVGPAPPSQLTTGIGDSELVLNWNPSNDSDLLGYQFYCDPPPSGVVPPPPDAGSGKSTDAGADAAVEGGTTSTPEAGTPNPGCPSTALIEGQRPQAAYLCGSVSGQFNGSGAATGLKNYTLYAVGVAGYDLVDNAGPLSNIACGTPEKINGFFNAYRQAGGKGGGGYCDIGGVPDPDELWALGGVLFAVALRRRRRRRR